MGKGQELYRKAKKIIPGGTQLLSKRPEMFLPDQWPSYYRSALGCHVTDLDGNEYLDVSYMGIGSCILGYACKEVDDAAKHAIDAGGMCTLNAPEEVELAEKLLSLHPWADMVRYGKAGGETVAIAVRIARAATHRDTVLICGYHGWQDWYLATNLRSIDALNAHHLSGLEPNGVPRSLEGTTLPFLFNDREGFLKVAKEHEGEIAAIVMEPVRNNFPDESFISTIREYATAHGIVLIFDEVTAGFRLTLGGSHLDSRIDIEPDIAVFGKALANGYPMTAIVGRSGIMTAAEDSFISSTFWTERVGLAAALATIELHERIDVSTLLNRIGVQVQSIWIDASATSGLPIEVGGMTPLSHFAFIDENPLVYKTLFTQIMLERGYLASTAFYASAAHSDKVLGQYAVDCKETFAEIARLKETGDLAKYLKGPVCHSGFQRLN